MRPSARLRSALTSARVRSNISASIRRLFEVTGSTYRCGIRIPKAYWQEMGELYDSTLTQPYRLYVVHRHDKSQRHLWRMAERIEHRVFWETDGNSRLSLLLTGYRWLKTTAMIVIVDQRPDDQGRPCNFAFGMVRVTWGSRKSVITLEALRKKPWHVSNVSDLLESNGIPQDAGQHPTAMDVTMLAILKEYRSRGRYYDKKVAVGLLAQLCQLVESSKTEWWFTILNRLAHRTVCIITKVHLKEFDGVSEEWLPYFGSKQSKPFWCNVPKWLEWLAYEHPAHYRDILQDGHSDLFAFEPRSSASLMLP